MDEPKLIRGAGWNHEGGRFAGYAVRGAAKAIELGTRAKDILDVEHETRRANKDVAGMLVERVRYGTKRATATVEPFEGCGPLPWGDLFQPDRERRAAGFQYV
jgi:hypothetical protein